MSVSEGGVWRGSGIIWSSVIGEPLREVHVCVSLVWVWYHMSFVQDCVTTGVHVQEHWLLGALGSYSLLEQSC